MPQKEKWSRGDSNPRAEADQSAASPCAVASLISGIWAASDSIPEFHTTVLSYPPPRRTGLGQPSNCRSPPQKASGGDRRGLGREGVLRICR